MSPVSFKSLFPVLCLGVVLIASASLTKAQTPKRVPMIYSTDLYQPPQDPDDHYDLAMLAALEELEIKALIFDLATSFRKPEEFGKTAVEQLAKITGHKTPPWAVGLREPLRTPDDQAFDQPEEFQGAVKLILETLEKSEEPVVMFLVGSCRDFAVAFNRSPDLWRKKVKALYVNAGNGSQGDQTEWNVTLDPNAYVALMAGGLPIYWCPCFTDVYQLPAPETVAAGKAFCTYFVVPNQAKLLASVRAPVKNYFSYALSQSADEPIGFLDKEPQPLPQSPRNMWCTGPFLHAAGREIFKSAESRWVAEPPKRVDEQDRPSVEVFRFEPIRIQIEMKKEGEKPVPVFRQAATGEKPESIRIFRYTHQDFNEIMPAVLQSLLETL